MRLFQAVGLPWNLALSLAAVIGACILVMDADGMAALIRHGPRAAPPPLFRSPIPLARGWRRLAWLAGFILVLAPLMMSGITGVRHASEPLVQAAIVAGLAAVLAVLIWSNVTGRTRVSTAAGVLVAALAVSPYALAGSRGWRLYAVITCLTALIIGLLFLTAAARHSLFTWRPRTRTGAGVRLALDGAGALVIMAVVFWPGLSPA